MNVRRAKTGNRVHISDMGVLFPLLPGDPARGAWGRKCSTRTDASEFEHFYPVPVCFGVIRTLMQHPLGGYGGLKLVYKIYAP